MICHDQLLKCIQTVYLAVLSYANCAVRKLMNRRERYYSYLDWSYLTSLPNSGRCTLSSIT